MVLCHLKDKLWDDYGDWLVDRVGFKRKDRYFELFATLHNIPFRFYITLDKNREADGLDLREEFALSMGYPEVKFDEGCSVLEMLVGLAIRVEREYIGDPKEEHPEGFFWEMIQNVLGMDKYWRYCSGPRYSEAYVERIINTWLDRDFRYDGYGSIFPLKNPSRDQREVEIWDQMNEYLMENYPM